MKKSIHLLIPGLLPETQFKFKNSFPNLAHILSKAEAVPLKNFSLEETLAQQFTLSSESLPVGALSAYYHGIEITSNDWFSQVEPIQTQLDAHTAFLIQGLQEILSKEEHALYQNALQPLLADSQKLYLKDQDWILKFNSAVDLVSNSIWDVLGKSLHCRLPSGPDAAQIQRLMTEAEMLLSDLPENQKRLEKNQPPVNGLWFFGFGAIPNEASCSFDLVLSNESCVKGLAKLSGSNYDSLSFQPEALKAEQLYVVDTKLFKRYKAGDIDAWLDGVNQYENIWFNYALQELSQGNLYKLSLDLGTGCRYDLTKKHLKYFWRRIKPIEEFINE